MKTFAMMILGCKVNDYEATYIREKMLEHYAEVPFKDKADIYIIFTCCVTNTAEAKSRKFIHDARRNNENAYIAAIGCLSQIKGHSEVFSDCDLVVGSDQKDKIVDLILAQEKRITVKDEVNKDFEELFISSYPSKSRAFLKIQDGCNQFCSYCVIPYSRGRERSARHEDVIRQARQLSHTHREIVLTGIHTGRYNDGTYNLYDLLKQLCEIDGLETIRLSSIEMTEISDEIIELMSSTTKLAHHLHIPVQSCDNDILKSMHRPYTIEEFKDRVAYIRKRIPGISISTDLILGFPGEDDERFQNVMRQLKEISFSFIHLFPYSRKSGTVADRMDGHVDPKIKKARVKEISEMQKEMTLEFKKSFLNKEVEVLIERNEEGYSYGYTKEYIYTMIEGVFEVGEILPCVIDGVDETKVSAHASR